MSNKTIHVTCKSTTSETSTAEITILDAEDGHIEGRFTPSVLDGQDVMFWFGEFLNGSKTDLSFTIQKLDTISMISHEDVKPELSSLTAVSESEYNAFLSSLARFASDFSFVDCHEYGEAYHLNSELIAYHEVICLGTGVFYLKL